MELIKKSLFVLSLLLVVAFAWIGTSIYFQSVSVDINPNADSYTSNLKETFDTTELDYVTERSTKEQLPVTADEFLSLIEED